MSTRYLSTGQAAARCSVSPDTVLRWIRSGALPARRTAGGHHRVAERDLERLMGLRPESGTGVAAGQPDSPIRYCWEFNGNGRLLDGCRDCAVFHMRALRCYEVIKQAPEALHSRVFCKGSCEECDYYRLVHQQETNVLVISDDRELTSLLRAGQDRACFNLEITDCEYATSAVVDRFRPDFAVVDCCLGEEKSRDISHHLLEDPRIPFVRVVLAAKLCELPGGCDAEVFARISRPFGVEEINACIRGALEPIRRAGQVVEAV